MSTSCVQNRTLEVTVVSCIQLRDMQWLSRQDPYVNLEYGDTKKGTRTCTDGGRNPVFGDKFTFTLIPGLTEIAVTVLNSNTVFSHDFIGSGKIQLQYVLSEGSEDKCWPIFTADRRCAGEVRVQMYCAQIKSNAPEVGNGSSQPAASTPPSFPVVQSAACSHFQPPLTYSTPPLYTNHSYPPHQSAAYPPSMAYTPPCPFCPHPHQAYPSAPYPPPPAPSPYPYAAPGSYGFYPTPPY